MFFSRFDVRLVCHALISSVVLNFTKSPSFFFILIFFIARFALLYILSVILSVCRVNFIAVRHSSSLNKRSPQSIERQLMVLSLFSMGIILLCRAFISQRTDIHPDKQLRDA